MSIPVNKTLEEVRSDLFSKISTVQQAGWLPEPESGACKGPDRAMGMGPVSALSVSYSYSGSDVSFICFRRMAGSSLYAGRAHQTG